MARPHRQQPSMTRPPPLTTTSEIPFRLPEVTTIVGASGSDSAEGAAYIYVKGNKSGDKKGNKWTTSPAATLDDPAPRLTTISDNRYPSPGRPQSSVAPGGRFRSGSGYVFKLGSSGWATSPMVTLHDPASTPGDSFGDAAAVAG